MTPTFAALLLALLSAPDVLGIEPPPDTPGSRLTVVADLGGTSALPYYRALNLLPAAGSLSASLPPPQIPHSASEESKFLPVHSEHLTPGWVRHQLVRAPGLSPFFLAGDDPRSHAWITEHLAQLKQLAAIGFIVNVQSAEALASLRGIAPGLTLVPASADDLARRLNLTHYPALVTATGIEQ